MKSSRLVFGVISACLAALSFLAFNILHIDRAWKIAARILKSVKATSSSWMKPDLIHWRIIESIFSNYSREKINTYGRHPRGTGALNSPVM